MMNDQFFPTLVTKDEEFAMPGTNTKIFKDECLHCFFTPLHPDGLFVCLKSFAGFCINHLYDYCIKTQRKNFLWIKEMDETDKCKDEESNIAPHLKIDNTPQQKINIEYGFVVFPALNVKIPIDKLTGTLALVCHKVIEGEGAKRAALLESGTSGWHGETKFISKHSNLKQLDNIRPVPPSGWICEEEGCGLTENLWINLTDGVIKCGRTQFIQEGVMTKGNNHMRAHYEATNYPLVVKLGTITKNDADVFSYDEDDSVIDLNLKAHLRHLGIDMDLAEKSEKTTLELELDMNQKWEWTICQEDGANLELAYGPGFTGMINIGSSCYINATIQMLLQIPDFVCQYGEHCIKHFYHVSNLADSFNDFNCQTAKVISSLMSGNFSQHNGKFNGIKPEQFRRVVGRDHREFSTSRQQDADEYLRYFLSKVDQNVIENVNPVNAVRFKIETRLLDCSSGLVQYKQNEELVLSLVVPFRSNNMEIQLNEIGEPIRPTVTFNECLKETFSEQTINDFRSPVTEKIGNAKLKRSIATFPNFLILQLQKFCITENWTIKKMDVNIDMPEIMNLEWLRSQGPQPGESLLPDNAGQKDIPFINPEFVETICSMGFSLEASRKAIYMTENSGVEQASEWLMNHLDDANINDEHPDLLPTGKASTIDGSPMTAQLMALGFSLHQAKYSLNQCKRDVNCAAEWLLAHADEVPIGMDIDTNSSVDVKSNVEYSDGTPKYHLIGFISHMGTSPNSGHYVCHLKKNGKWYLFNDEKVAVSQKPPIQLGYIYLYKRIVGDQ